MFDVYTSSNATKRYKEDIDKQLNKEVPPMFLDVKVLRQR